MNIDILLRSIFSVRIEKEISHYDDDPFALKVAF
jgi:hypothetical protein